MPLFQFLIISIALLLTGCTEQTPEEIMTETVNDLIEAVENKNFQQLSHSIHPDFMGAGQPDKASLIRWGESMTRRYSHIHSAWTVESIQYYPDVQRGKVVLKGGMTGHAGLLPKDFSRMIEVRLDLVFENEQWQVIGLEYTRQ